MSNYELVIVLDGKATSTKKKGAAEKVEKLVSAAKGKVGKMRDLGTKDLAYKIQKSETGAYFAFPLELESLAVKEISNKLRLDTDLIRYLLIKKD